MKWTKLGILLILLLWLLIPAVALADTSQNVTVTASGYVENPGTPSSLTLTYISDYEVGISWEKGASANNTMIRRVVGRPPTDRTDGVEVYYGTESYVVDYNVNLDTGGGTYYYRAWSEDSDGDWSSEYAEGSIGGIGVTLIALAILALGLTVAMFHTRNALLGFPSCIMWAILGAFAYANSTTAWGDWQYYLFFASAFGMTIFSALAAYGLREKRDTLGDEAMEEEEEEGEYIEEEKVSRRTRQLRERADRRRIGENMGRGHKW